MFEELERQIVTGTGLFMEWFQLSHLVRLVAFPAVGALCQFKKFVILIDI